MQVSTCTFQFARNVCYSIICSWSFTLKIHINLEGNEAKTSITLTKYVRMELSHTHLWNHLYSSQWIGNKFRPSKWVRVIDAEEAISNIFVFADILNTILGVPTECFHQGGVWPCKLSFSCWLQGGKHARGCGNNKWFFSCCIAAEGDISPAANLVETALVEYNKKVTNLPKRVFLRRRDENDISSKVSPH